MSSFQLIQTITSSPCPNVPTSIISHSRPQTPNSLECKAQNHAYVIQILSGWVPNRLSSRSPILTLTFLNSPCWANHPDDLGPIWLTLALAYTVGTRSESVPEWKISTTWNLRMPPYLERLLQLYYLSENKVRLDWSWPHPKGNKFTELQ